LKTRGKQIIKQEIKEIGTFKLLYKRQKKFFFTI